MEECMDVKTGRWLNARTDEWMMDGRNDWWADEWVNELMNG